MTQTVPDISPLMPMHQDPLLVGPILPNKYICRYHIVYAPSQWETTLQCNAASHWLGVYTHWCVASQRHFDVMATLSLHCVSTRNYLLAARASVWGVYILGLVGSGNALDPAQELSWGRRSSATIRNTFFFIAIRGADNAANKKTYERRNIVALSKRIFTKIKSMLCGPFSIKFVLTSNTNSHYKDKAVTRPYGDRDLDQHWLR